MCKNGKSTIRVLIEIVSLFVVCVSLLEGCVGSNPTDSDADSSSTNPQTSNGAGDFTIQNGEITLAGTLTLPSTPGPHPAVVVVHGSGRATRNGFSILSDIMGDVGIAVLRYDKRGVAESSGTYENVGSSNSVRVFDDLASDAIAWVEFLRNHADINSNQIGLIGASQAGWIIPLAASRSDEVAFIVNIVGPAVTVGQEIFYSDLTGEGRFGEDRTINGFTIEQLTEMTRNFAGPHGFDPREAIRSLDIPALWVLGELDESIPTALTVEILEGIIKEQSNSFTVQVKPSANHGMRNAITGATIPYIAPPGGINDWIIDIVNGT